MAQRRGGLISFAIDGVLYDAKGNFSSNLGRPKRDAIVGSDRVHGYKEMPQAPFIEGEITDRGTLDVNALVTMNGVTVTLQYANGKVFALRDAWYAGDGTTQSEEGNIQIRFEGMAAEEIA